MSKRQYRENFPTRNMNAYRIGFSFSFQGGPIKTNYRNVQANSAEDAIIQLLKYTPSALKAWEASPLETTP